MVCEVFSLSVEKTVDYLYQCFHWHNTLITACCVCHGGLSLHLWVPCFCLREGSLTQRFPLPKKALLLFSCESTTKSYTPWQNVGVGLSDPISSFLLLHALSSPFCKLLFSCPSCTLHVYWTFDSCLLLVRFVCWLRPFSSSGFGPGLLHHSVSHRTSLCEWKISLRHLDLGPIPGVSSTLPAPTWTILSIW